MIKKQDCFINLLYLKLNWKKVNSFTRWVTWINVCFYSPCSQWIPFLVSIKASTCNFYLQYCVTYRVSHKKFTSLVKKFVMKFWFDFLIIFLTVYINLAWWKTLENFDGAKSIHHIYHFNKSLTNKKNLNTFQKITIK